MKTSAIAASAFVLAIATAQSAAAQMTLAQAQQALDTDDASQIQSAIEAIGIAGDAHGVPLIVARVHRGLPPAQLESALDTLAVLGSAEAGPLLFEMLSHRRASVRLRAVQAIATCHPAGADRALIAALSDSSADVRDAAASTLGDLRAVSAIDSLFLAFDHGVTSAGMAIAHMARPDDVTRMLGLLGHVPFTQMGPILADMMGRAELAQRSRLQVVSALGELASAEARGLLEQYASSHPATDPVRRAAEQAAARIAQ